MFDLQGQFTAKVISATDKACIVSYPTDEDWCGRVKSQRTIRRSLGRKKAEYDVSPTYDFDAQLLERIRIDKDGDPLDKNEATHVIDRLDRTESLSVEREGGAYRITLKVYGGARVVHVLKVPSQKAADDYYRNSGKTRFEGRNTETRSFLEPSGALYDSLFAGSEGYAAAEGIAPLKTIPINHKAAALTEMLLAIAEALSEDDIDPEA